MGGLEFFLIDLIQGQIAQWDIFLEDFAIGSTPSSKWGVIFKGRAGIVVSVDEWILRKVAALRSEDFTIEPWWGMDACRSLEVFELGKHILHILAVSLVVTRPIASNIVVFFEVKPEAIIVLLSNNQDDSIDLELGAFSSARPDEEFWFESSTFSEYESILDTEVKVDAFEGECADIGEGISGLFEAVEVGLEGDSRRCVKADEGTRWGEQSCDAQDL